MKTLYRVIFLLFTSQIILAQNFSTIPPSDPLIEYTGRIDFGIPEAPVFSYSGVSIRAAFNGSSISAILEDENGANYYYFILDGVVQPKLKIFQGINTYSAGSALKDTIHEIEIFRLTEQMFGKTRFHGFIVDSGKTISPLTNIRANMIEFIGNSITCGYGNEGTLNEKFSDSTENQYYTYAAITSRYFNARQLAVCKSGIGIYRNYAGPSEGSVDCMPPFYSRIFLYDETPLYDFKMQPDLICIDLGTNDFSTPGGDSARYVNAYLKFIDQLQTKYDKPEIVCLIGTMLQDSILTCERNYVQHVAAEANKKGNGNVYFFEMSAQTGNLGYGIDYHPTIKQHYKMAAELTKYISRLKGWEIVKSIEY